MGAVDLAEGERGEVGTEEVVMEVEGSEGEDLQMYSVLNAA